MCKSCNILTLYNIFEVEPVERRQAYDGKSKIVINSSTWQKAFEELWNLLVPSSGHASTLQGEVIRITGRISNEIEGNGGKNWDNDFIKMSEALIQILSSENKLNLSEIKEAGTIVRELRGKAGNTYRLAELAVNWVKNNPDPIKLDHTNYKR